jgi:hypothetical protein
VGQGARRPLGGNVPTLSEFQVEMMANPDFIDRAAQRVKESLRRITPRKGRP